MSNDAVQATDVLHMTSVGNVQGVTSLIGVDEQGGVLVSDDGMLEIAGRAVVRNASGNSRARLLFSILKGWTNGPDVRAGCGVNKTILMSPSAEAVGNDRAVQTVRGTDVLHTTDVGNVDSPIFADEQGGILVNGGAMREIAGRALTRSGISAPGENDTRPGRTGNNIMTAVVEANSCTTLQRPNPAEKSRARLLYAVLNGWTGVRAEENVNRTSPGPPDAEATMCGSLSGGDPQPGTVVGDDAVQTIDVPHTAGAGSVASLIGVDKQGCILVSEFAMLDIARRAVLRDSVNASGRGRMQPRRTDYKIIATGGDGNTNTTPPHPSPSGYSKARPLPAVLTGWMNDQNVRAEGDVNKTIPRSPMTGVTTGANLSGGDARMGPLVGLRQRRETTIEEVSRGLADLRLDDKSCSDDDGGGSAPWDGGSGAGIVRACEDEGVTMRCPGGARSHSTQIFYKEGVHKPPAPIQFGRDGCVLEALCQALCRTSAAMFGALNVLTEMAECRDTARLPSARVASPSDITEADKMLAIILISLNRARVVPRKVQEHAANLKVLMSSNTGGHPSDAVEALELMRRVAPNVFGMFEAQTYKMERFTKCGCARTSEIRAQQCVPLRMPINRATGSTEVSTAFDNWVANNYMAVDKGQCHAHGDQGLQECTSMRRFDSQDTRGIIMVLSSTDGNDHVDGNVVLDEIKWEGKGGMRRQRLATSMVMIGNSHYVAVAPPFIIDGKRVRRFRGRMAQEPWDQGGYHPYVVFYEAPDPVFPLRSCTIPVKAVKTMADELGVDYPTAARLAHVWTGGGSLASMSSRSPTAWECVPRSIPNPDSYLCWLISLTHSLAVDEWIVDTSARLISEMEGGITDLRCNNPRELARLLLARDTTMRDTQVSPGDVCLAVIISALTSTTRRTIDLNAWTEALRCEMAAVAMREGYCKW